SKLEIYSWYVTGSEKTALNALLDEVQKCLPGVSIVNAAQDRLDIAMAELPIRLANGNPPDSYQTIAGGSELGMHATQGATEPLDTLSAQEGWPAAMPKAVLDFAGRNGHLYAVPLEVERDNPLFYNKATLTQNGLAAPSTPAQFLSVAAALKAKGITPLAVS